MGQVDRRAFLKGGAGVAAGGALLGGPFQGLAAAAANPQGRPHTSSPDLQPVKDLSDGEVRLYLPAGFEYRSFNPAGSELSDGSITPPRHDGMAAFHGHGRNSILVRNQEINGPTGAFGDKDSAYDPKGPGGTVTLEVTPEGHVVHGEVSLNGTQKNCSGGPMPWHSWITCEETVNGPDVGDDFTGQDNDKLREKHGYLFEVPARGESTREPIRSAGRFQHEAAIYDPLTGAVYLTEDFFGGPSGLYRYLPPQNPMATGKLLDGGRLQMLAVAGQPNAELHKGQPRGTAYDVRWVDIEEPDPDFGTDPEPSNNDASAFVGDQGRAQGAALFSRLEGAAYAHGVVYFCSTQGGRQVGAAPDGFGNGHGQVWAYHTYSQKLQLIYESPDPDVLDMPDNVTTSRRGTLVLCEDGEELNYLRGLTSHGHLFDFARLVKIPEDPGAEFAGSTFSHNGRTLFVNIQSSEGRSFAIWGPWRRVGF